MVTSSNRFLTRPPASPSAIEVAETCHKIPTLLPTFVRCGKLECRCTDGHRHGPYWVLRWREGPTHRRRYVRATDVEAVRAVVEGRRRERATERVAFADDLAMLRRLWALRRELEITVAADRRDQ